jgi:hypothetical protein
MFSSPLRPEQLWGPPSRLFDLVPGALSAEVKRPWREPHRSPLCSAEVKNDDVILRLPIRVHGAERN